MPLPDLARPARVEARLLLTKPIDSTTATVLTCAANTTLRLRTIYITNQTAAAQSFNLSFVRSGVTYPLHSGVSIPPKNLFNATTIDDAVYLEPGDSLQFAQTATTANNLTLFVSYESIT